MTNTIPNFKSFGENSRCVVIGATGGIGSAFVGHLEEAENIAEVISLSRSTGFDFTDEASVEAAAQKIKDQGGADLIILATGVLHDGDLQPEKSLRDFDFENFQDVFGTNTTGPALVMKHFLPLLLKDRKSVFAALSARVGSISDNGIGGWASYRASKAALNMVIKCAAIEMGRRYKQAVIVGLHPGTVDTDLSAPFQGNVPEGKLFSAEYSTAKMLNVIEDLGADDSGKIFDYAGEEVLP